MTEKLIKFFCVLAGLQLLLVLFIFLFAKNVPVQHAVFGMGLGLYLFWVILGGLVMLKFRDKARSIVQKINLDWRLKFVLFTTALALIEEAITTAMTNTAPFYGVSMAAAHITASANYWDVVLTHSVILLVPMFGIWAWLLSKYDFRPNQVFLLWGLSGWFAEFSHSGIGHIGEIGLWVLVYGLMIYLPAYSIPQNRPGKKLNPWLYPVLIIGVVIVGAIIGGFFGTIIKHIRPPHYFPGVS